MKAASSPHRKTRIFALVLGILLSALLAFCAVYGYSVNQHSADVAYAMIAVVLVGGPMLLLLLVTTLYLRWKSGTFDGLGKPWLCVLLSVAVLPLLLLKDQF